MSKVAVNLVPPLTFMYIYKIWFKKNVSSIVMPLWIRINFRDSQRREISLAAEWLPGYERLCFSGLFVPLSLATCVMERYIDSQGAAGKDKWPSFRLPVMARLTQSLYQRSAIAAHAWGLGQVKWFVTKIPPNHYGCHLFMWAGHLATSSIS
jgi:hypothetical protein